MDKNGFLRAVDRKTLCATFVDNQLFDCLVEYERPALLFHAIVENDVDKSTCLPPDQSYAFFFKKWGMDSSPLTSVGEFESYEELRKTLVALQKNIANSTVKKDELGAILYFVSKNEGGEVISMAKFETKESLALSHLIKTLKNFWIKNENIIAWSRELDIEYNNAFEDYMFYLESLDINDFEGYMAVGQLAYKQLKEDIDLYAILKKDIPNFLSIIYKMVGYEG